MRPGCWIALHLLSFTTLTACLDGGGADGGDPPGDELEKNAESSAVSPTLAATAAAGYRIELVRTLPLTIDVRHFTVTLARVRRPDGGRTYVEWIPSDKPGPRPLVVTTAPYQGVDWTGEALDARWATYQPQADGLFLDRDGPGFDGKARIVFDRKTPQAVAEEAIPQLLNDFGSLTIFGRYYAGGSVRDDVADMAAGMWFAAQQPTVDRTRIGVWGGSWGGFEALYAAQQADPTARPRAVAAMFPPSDFAEWVGHALTRTGTARDLLQPYVRRLYATTGGPPTQPGTNYLGLRAADLCATLPETLSLHDEHDNLVPVQQTQRLVAACPQVAPLYWPRTGPMDPAVWTHGPLLEGAAPQAVSLYALTYLHLRIARPDQPFVLEFYAPSSLTTQLQELHDAQAAGRDVSYAVPRLYDLIDARVYLIDLASCGSAAGCTFEAGVTVVARLMNQIWGTSYASAWAPLTVAATLATPRPR